MAKTITEKYCTSCGAHLVDSGYVQFQCPTCKTILGRCVSCRKQSNPYTCPECGFTGP